ncbi:NAD(P)/FAD-dependent oxidoreductase [Nonomuraea angiospora]|uniref:NAD(P)/FAD-dependent oxidoreductase n=1 Tax=Nonomuraea angiospora TaxID=46172 RepID=UPI00299FF961|nr:NAD(P)/FAD-dependent oxidoreductase [Nonomuraea angiospora]MDX3106700.1 NAD(P)/FAD-dependent oxidoreductase [Nonomuraea angiospora]
MSANSYETVDVVVIGGGPGGATAASTIAAEGRSVLLLERSPFPRFHIGESLLPYMAGVLEQMGLLEPFADNGYVPKCGAEFTDGTGSFRRVSFEDQGPGRHHQTFQVERAHFDNALLEHAREAGAQIRNPAPVDELIVEDGRVVGVRYRYEGETREVRAQYVVDASGRSGKVAQTFGLRRSVDQLRMVAIYRHFTGLNEAANPGERGDIQIGNHKDGWVWAIPVWEDTISIGTVMHKDTFRRHGEPEQIFDEHRARIPRIAQRLEGTEPSTKIRIETDYCYLSDQIAGPGWLMVGDAGCFVDPIFSGGVYLAMVSGREAGRTVAAALEHPSRTEQLQASYESFYKTGYDTYFRLIRGFYDYKFNFGQYREDLPDFIEERHVSLLLAGDFWSQGNALARYLKSERRWDTFAPFEYFYGCPVYPDLELLERVETGV